MGLSWTAILGSAILASTVLLLDSGLVVDFESWVGLPPKNLWRCWTVYNHLINIVNSVFIYR